MIAGAQLAFSFLYSQDSGPWHGATHICAHKWVFPFQANLENSSRKCQWFVSMVILNPIKLTTNIHHHTEGEGSPA